ncbi:transposase [Microcystis panniformis FACHB-1757]|uniref:Transposase n=1 Tax=Microcystis panniformis FACHB-1757 TaxID=1638788 RepID=A0A0K1S8W8_9CHRO|nr:transposase [Microcystis panniformis FACHB-1757]
MSIVFYLERTNQLSLLPDKDLVDLCPPIEPYQVTKNLQNLLFVLHFINAPYRINFENFAKLEIGRKQGNIKL